MDLLNIAIGRFNDLPSSERKIAEDELYILDISYYRSLDWTNGFYYDGDNPDDLRNYNHRKVGRSRFLWVGRRGTNLTADESSFVLLEEQKEANTELMYEMQELVFNLPTLNADLTTRNNGNNIVFCPFQSNKGLTFDDHMQMSATYNPHYADTVIGEGTLELHLMYAPDGSLPAPVIADSPHYAVVFATLHLSDPTSMQYNLSFYPSSTSDFVANLNPSGLKGTFYWVWSSDNFVAVEGVQLHELTFTMTVKSPIIHHDLYAPPAA